MLMLTFWNALQFHNGNSQSTQSKYIKAQYIKNIKGNHKLKQNILKTMIQKNKNAIKVKKVEKR